MRVLSFDAYCTKACSHPLQSALWLRPAVAISERDPPELRAHIDENHVEMSLQRGYSTRRILGSPGKPERPMMVMAL